MTISLGIGLTLLLTLSFVANNLKKEISDSIPSLAPDLFFVSIDKDVQGDLQSYIEGVDPNAEIEFSPMASASFISLNGTPIEEIVSQSNRSLGLLEVTGESLGQRNQSLTTQLLREVVGAW